MHKKVMVRTQTGCTEVYAQSLSAESDLDLWPSKMVLVRDTSSCHDWWSYVRNYFQIPTCMGWTRSGFTEVYAQSLSADRDLDLWPSKMVLVCDTSSCHDDLVIVLSCHLCQIIFKSHHVRLSSDPDTILEHTHTYSLSLSHTHTHTEGKLYMPFRHFMAGAYKRVTAKLRGKRNDDIYVFFFTWIKLSISQLERRIH